MAAPVLLARRLLPAMLPVAPTPGHELDLTLEPGTICCIVGPPNSGKTTWLRTLAAVDPPASGELTLAGQDAVRLSPQDWRRLRTRVAYVSADAALLSVLRGLANVTLAADYHRMGDVATNREKASILLDRLGWSGPLDVLPAYLDAHQRLLLALARCLILDPLILFLHEPFRMMDVAGWRNFGSLLAGLARERGLVQVVITHHLPFVRRWSNRILFAGPDGVREYAGWAGFSADPDAAVQEYLQSSGIGPAAM